MRDTFAHYSCGRAPTCGQLRRRALDHFEVGVRILLDRSGTEPQACNTSEY